MGKLGHIESLGWEVGHVESLGWEVGHIEMGNVGKQYF